MRSSTALIPACLELRPPTPPKDTCISQDVDDAIDFLNESREVELALVSSAGTAQRPSTIITTPDRSSSPGQGSENLNASKRVGFSSTPVYHEPRNHFLSPVLHLQYRKKPTHGAKPLRSILKQGLAPLPPTPEDLDTRLCYFSPEDPGSFTRMLQSVLHSLDSQRQDQRLDAYLTLNGTLQKYDGIVEIQAMASKMPVVTHHLKRDMVWKSDSGSVDMNIVQQALKLTAAIISNKDLSRSLDNEFRCHVLDRSITVIESPDTPKAIIKLHLYLLGTSFASPPQLKNSKANRLITALQTLETRVSGNSSVTSRLIIYRRLLDVARDAMLRRASDWLEHVVHSVLSSLKDIRVRALDVMTGAGSILGTEHSFSKALADLLELKMDEDGDQLYYEFFSVQVVQMLNNKEMSYLVPQIWIAIVSCFRGKSLSSDKWYRFKSWLLIIQKCLNASDMNVKYQAYIAWRKFVFVTMPDESTPQHMQSLLKRPCLTGLEKRGNEKSAKQSRQFAQEVAHSLFYCALRPGLTYREIDHAWTEYVEPILNALIQSAGRGRVAACQILKGFFTSTNLWDAAAVCNATVIKPEDLPRLDPRWVRSRASRVIRILEPMLHATMWVSEEMATEPLDSTLDAFYCTIAEAATQEVKTSNDLKEAVAHLVNLFTRLWTTGSTKNESAEPWVFINRYTELLEKTVQTVGVTAFAEDILTRNNQNGLEAALTPSSKPSKHHSPPHAPLVSLFGLLYQPPQQTLTASMEAPFSTLGSSILDLLESTRSGQAAKLELLSRSMHVWSALYSAKSSPSIVRLLWSNIVEHSISILRDDHVQVHGESSQSVGLGLRSAQDILYSGIDHTSLEPACALTACSLLNEMFDVAKKVAGPGGTVLGVAEPFAKTLANMESALTTKVRLYLASQLLSNTCWPKDRADLEHSRKALCGMSLAPQKGAVFDPFEHMYRMLNNVSIRAYETIEWHEAESTGAVMDFFDAMLVFLTTCPATMLQASLRKTQMAVSVWVEDRTHKVPVTGPVSDKICKLWQRLLNLLAAQPLKDSTLLKAFEPLFVAGMSSPRKALVNSTIVFWNSNFGSLESIQYPSRLEGVLRVRREETELLLPTFPSTSSEDLPNLPAFYESQQDDFPELSSADCTPLSRNDYSIVPNTALPFSSASGFAPLVAIKATVKSPARPKSRGSVKASPRSTPRARLRHDDSQIQFAPIESNSSPIQFDESQNLTEHQKEVAERQLQTGRMYIGLSSSPAVKPLSLAKELPNRLDFMPEELEPEAANQLTPEDLPDLPNIMSDEIPSSPTPSSTKGSDYNRFLANEGLGEEFFDPPSSPPEEQFESEETHPENVPSVPEFAEVAETDSRHDGHGDPYNPTMNDLSNFPGDSRQLMDDMADLPDDSRQLRMEAEAAESSAKATFHGIAMSNIDVHSDLLPASLRSQEDIPELSRQDISDAPVVSAAEETTPKRKRKRVPSRNSGHSKRRKSHSPLHSAISQIPSSRDYATVGSQVPDDDSEIGDEIVVAGSQNRPSLSPEPELEAEEMPHVREISTSPDMGTEIKATATSSAEQLRNRPGRPKKKDVGSDQSTIIPGTMAAPTEGGSASRSPPSNRRRRTKSSRKTNSPKSNRVSRSSLQVDGSGIEQDTSIVRDTPHVANSKQQQHYTASVDSDEEVSIDGSNGRRQTLVAVVPTPPKRVAAQDDHQEAPKSSNVATHSAILARLRSVVADLSRVVLSVDEVKEIDEVLFDVKSEAHDARRRAQR